MVVVVIVTVVMIGTVTVVMIVCHAGRAYASGKVGLGAAVR